MRVDLVGLAVNDVDAAAIGSPAGHARREMLFGVGNALVVLFLIFVLFGVGRGVAALPEGFDEVVALLVVGELLESRALFVGDDVDYVLFQPLLVGLAQFLFQATRILLPLFFVRGPLERIHGVGGSLGLRGWSLRGAGHVRGGLLILITLVELAWLELIWLGWSWATAPQTIKPTDANETLRTA